MQYMITENTLQSASPIPCNNETNFNFDNCFSRAMSKKLMMQFKCVVPFISPKLQKGNKFQTYITISNFKSVCPYGVRRTVSVTLQCFITFLVPGSSSSDLCYY